MALSVRLKNRLKLTNLVAKVAQSGSGDLCFCFRGRSPKFRHPCKQPANKKPGTLLKTNKDYFRQTHCLIVLMLAS